MKGEGGELRIQRIGSDEGWKGVVERGRKTDCDAPLRRSARRVTRKHLSRLRRAQQERRSREGRHHRPGVFAP